MNIKTQLNKAGRIAKNSSREELNYIKLDATAGTLEITATDAYRLYIEQIEIDKDIKIHGFLHYSKIKEIKTLDDVKKHIEKGVKFPALPKFKFPQYFEIKTDKLKRFCKMNKGESIILKLSNNKVVLFIKGENIKSSVKINIIKSNIRYYRTMLNTKYILEALPTDKILRIKTDKSGKNPLTFGNQIIMPVKIRE